MIYRRRRLELAWKTLKDYMNERGEEVKFPREVLWDSRR